MTIGDNLKEWRKLKGHSQTALGELAGIDKNTISDIETGKREPYPATLKVLADALNISVEELSRGPRPVKQLPPLADRLKGRVTIDVNGVEVELTEEEKAKILAMAKILKGGG